MRSFRSRIVAWHLLTAAGASVVVAVLATACFVAGVSWNARQRVAAAALALPATVQRYETQGETLAQAAPAIVEHYRETGIVAFVLAGNPADGLRALAGPPGFPMGAPGAFGHARFEPGSGLPQGPPRRSVLDALLSNVPPQRVPVDGGMVVLGVDPAHYHAVAEWFALSVAGLMLVIIGTAWFIAISTARHALEPLLRTTEALDRFGDGNFTPEPVRTDDRSELGNLARSYNRAVAEITRAFDERSKTEAEMRQFVADAGHQLRTPLTVIMGHLSAFSFRPNEPKMAAALDNLLQESRRMRALIEDLIVLAQLEEDGYRDEVTDVAEVARRLVEGYALNPKLPPIQLDAGEEALATGRDVEIHSALDALIDNAVKYGNHTPVEVSVTREGGNVVARVADRGTGLPGTDLERAFDRFYRGSSSEGVQGSGLGLPIVSRIVHRAGGRVSLRNRTDGGLTAEIRLPQANKIPNFSQS